MTTNTPICSYCEENYPSGLETGVNSFFFNGLFIKQETLVEASQHEPVAEELTNSNEELQKELEKRPEAEHLDTETTDATDGFAKSQKDLADLIQQLEDYSDVAEKFTKSFEDLTEWLPTVKLQTSELKPISTQPNVIEEQIHETEVSGPATVC